MLYERGKELDCAYGIKTLEDLKALAADVCGAAPFPLDDDELREVFESTKPRPASEGKDPREENLHALRAAIWAKACQIWSVR